MTNRLGILYFSNDLRLHDNPALVKAAREVDQLLCIYQPLKAWCQHTRSMQAEPGEARQHFLQQSLVDLDSQLQSLGQRLWILPENGTDTLKQLLSTMPDTSLYRCSSAGWYENTRWESLSAAHSQRHDDATNRFQSIDTYTLFDISDLPFTLDNMPSGFSGVRRKLEKLKPVLPINPPRALPRMPDVTADLGLLSTQDWVNATQISQSSARQDESDYVFEGGETQGLQHLRDYLDHGAASSYKQTRNALDGWRHSCKFSPWLATGSLSVRKIVAELKAYESEHGANESTYWIFVELLWREYFQYYAKRHGASLYHHGGPNHKTLSVQADEQILQQWKDGETDFPLVNACMTELNHTGFLSNRGRQIVASCLVNELAQDWRYGAAYFEQLLIDYDVATNWGNWSYIAGAGPLTVDKRHFNLDKQRAQFDPKDKYTNHWLARRDAAKA